MANDTDMSQLALAQNLPPELMLLKLENETIMSAAVMRPRDSKKIVAQLTELIEAYPQAAEEAVYSKPVGTVTEFTCDNAKCGIKFEVSFVANDTACPNCETVINNKTRSRKIKKFAEGLSIRAAESIRSIFGYTRLATTCDIRPDGTAKLTGILVDYAAGNVTSDERIVSPFYKAKGGAMTRTPEDRFINVVVKAEKAKLRRDVILDSTPGIVKAMFRDMCEQKMIDLVSPEVVEQKIIPAFAEYGITQAHLDKIIGRQVSLGLKEQDRLRLKQILTALKNEETTVRELLADLDDKEPTTKPTGPVTAADLVNGKETKPATTVAARTDDEVRALIQGWVDLFGSEIASMTDPKSVNKTTQDMIATIDKSDLTTEQKAAAMTRIGNVADGRLSSLKTPAVETDKPKQKAPKREKGDQLPLSGTGGEEG